MQFLYLGNDSAERAPLSLIEELSTTCTKFTDTTLSSFYKLAHDWYEFDP